ncbi:SUKH-3 domain-containing protein [uncultured Clostridium sp.]|uniref:SUKH-3 domain-containing protein n=1 Tax=uncultured Clostridium sp. TaxID=59620 RepID=UPI0026073F4C|nr:SUKH-3 domain-containing protein [uncultured Clostridium sp.]
MNEESKEILRKNGWYEGRKINGAEWYQYYERGGVRVFDTFKKFFEEFGLLNIKYLTQYGSETDASIIPTIYIPKSFEGLIYEDEEDILEYQEMSGEELLLVGIFNFGNIRLFISESGKFYDQYGFIAKNKDELWHCIFNDNFPNFIAYENLV